MYENMDIYITGEGAESNKKRAASNFLEVAQLDMEELKIRALIKDSLICSPTLYDGVFV